MERSQVKKTASVFSVLSSYKMMIFGLVLLTVLANGLNLLVPKLIAHSIDGYKDTYYGVMIAQKGGLTAEHNLSSFTLQQFEAFLRKYREKRK